MDMSECTGVYLCVCVLSRLNLQMWSSLLAEGGSLARLERCQFRHFLDLMDQRDLVNSSQENCFVNLNGDPIRRPHMPDD